MIARAGKPLVELTPYEVPKPRAGGIWAEKVRMGEDFDDPVPEMDNAIYDADASP